MKPTAKQVVEVVPKNNTTSTTSPPQLLEKASPQEAIKTHSGPMGFGRDSIGFHMGPYENPFWPHAFP